MLTQIQLISTDVLDGLKLLRARKVASFDLVYADPPFNWGRAYDVADDRKPKDEYKAWASQWVREAASMVSPAGAMVVNTPDDWAAMYATEMEAAGLTLRRWIIWHYRFGQNTPGNFISSKAHVLYFVRDVRKCIFNAGDVLEPSLRALYGDPRTKNKRDGSPDGMRVPFDVWAGDGFSRIVGNNRERRHAHDNQIPEAYFKRLVLAVTNPGSRVLDLFTGSGGLPAVCYRYGRRCVGFDLSPAYAESAHTRVCFTKPEISLP